MDVKNALEIVLAALPFASDLDLHFDTAVHFFRSALVIDTKLNDIAILQGHSSTTDRPKIVERHTLIGYGRDSVFGFESLMWFKNVPDDDFVSRTKN